jgi:hypothetical protein
VLAIAIALEAVRGGRGDPTWETRWRSLDPAERAWLAMMSTSREWIGTLTDPEEIKLAKGFRRHESRRLLSIDLICLPLLLAAAALSLALHTDLIVLTVFFAYGLVRNIWTYRRGRQIKGALEAQREIAAAAAA